MQTTSTATVTSTFTSSDAVECAFDSDGAAHLMGILSNMYRDAPEAVLREYAANARDSHVQAGNPDPIQVDLPTDWNPVLTITDHGVGLSEDEIVSVYSRYGKSTKRDTNDQVGAFGIGAKSAFTIATQFTVTGVKDGRRTVALFALNDAGVGTVDIKARATTDEPNGVTVAIAVHDIAAMRQAATRLFGTWEPGSVLVDGEAPEYLPDSMLRITDDIYAHYHRGGDRRESTTGVTIVMGGIPYPSSPAMLRMAARRNDNTTAQELIETLADNRTSLRLLAFVPVGGVDITPSREDLRDTPRTIAVLARVISDYVTGKDAAVARMVDAEPTPMHVSVRLDSLGGFVSSLAHGVTWRGSLLPGKITLPYPVITLEEAGRSHRTKCETHIEFHLGHSIEHVVVITGVDATSQKTVRRLANRYMTHHSLSTMIMAPDEQGAASWFAYGDSSPVATMTFADFKAAATALPTVTTRRETRYDVMIGSQEFELTCSELTERADLGARLLLAERYYGHDRLAADALAPTDVLVMLTGTKTETAFRRRFPSVISAGPILREHAQRTLDMTTEQERLALEHRQNSSLDRLTRNTELHTLEPVRALVEPYQARAIAHESVQQDRLDYLRRAEAELGIQHSPITPKTGLPLLDLALRFLDYFTPDAALREHLALYLDAAHAHHSHPAVA